MIQTLPPRLSVIIVLYNMAREAERSLYALTANYQRGVGVQDYEVIVVENGSSNPVSRDQVEAFGPNFRYLGIPRAQAKSSPVFAINEAVALVQAPLVGIMIDGARIASPGVLAGALAALDGFDRAVVATIGLHLGTKMQTHAAETGYNQAVEDQLLKTVGWQANGYDLFGISVLTGVNLAAWFGPMAESNLIFLPRNLYDEIGGFDERFDLPGGSFANLEFYNRASQVEGAMLISLFGEATFHQIHGGVMSSRPAATVPDEVSRYKAEYLEKWGKPFRFSQDIPHLFGRYRPEIAPILVQAKGPWNRGTGV